MTDDSQMDKRARFAFAKRFAFNGPSRGFAFAKRSAAPIAVPAPIENSAVAADSDSMESSDDQLMDKRARFAFAKRFAFNGPSRNFAFAKRSPYSSSFA
uniref:Uncharacterized protein n=1 Tax=Panagrolaimus sp. PS1159 TaxID=55785 RepID=A0AC35ES98_9BILA